MLTNLVLPFTHATACWPEQQRVLQEWPDLQNNQHCGCPAGGEPPGGKAPSARKSLAQIAPLPAHPQPVAGTLPVPGPPAGSSGTVLITFPDNPQRVRVPQGTTQPIIDLPLFHGLCLSLNQISLPLTCAALSNTHTYTRTPPSPPAGERAQDMNWNAEQGILKPFPSQMLHCWPGRALLIPYLLSWCLPWGMPGCLRQHMRQDQMSAASGNKRFGNGGPVDTLAECGHPQTRYAFVPAVPRKLSPGTPCTDSRYPCSFAMKYRTLAPGQRDKLCLLSAQDVAGQWLHVDGHLLVSALCSRFRPWSWWFATL